MSSGRDNCVGSLNANNPIVGTASEEWIPSDGEDHTIRVVLRGQGDSEIRLISDDSRGYLVSKVVFESNVLSQPREGLLSQSTARNFGSSGGWAPSVSVPGPNGTSTSLSLPVSWLSPSQPKSKYDSFSLGTVSENTCDDHFWFNAVTKVDGEVFVDDDWGEAKMEGKLYSWTHFQVWLGCDDC